MWRAGGRKKATVAMLDIPAIYIDRNFKEEEQDEVRKACQMCTCIWPLCKAFELIQTDTRCSSCFFISCPASVVILCAVS